MNKDQRVAVTTAALKVQAESEEPVSILISEKPSDPDAAGEWRQGILRIQVAMWLDAYMNDRCVACGHVSENVDDWLAQNYRFAGGKLICADCFKGE